jgi:tetratricopeptide (TPR) repeat protein
MRKAELPDYKKKQRLLYVDKTPAKTLSEFGARCLEEGRVHDAMEFYQRAGDREAIAGIASFAEESGDVMLFQQARKTLGDAVSPEDWNRIGEKAFSLKKFAFASHAFEKAGNAQRSADTAARINPNPAGPASP